MTIQRCDAPCAQPLLQGGECGATGIAEYEVKIPQASAWHILNFFAGLQP